MPAEIREATRVVYAFGSGHAREIKSLSKAAQGPTEA
jgi:hypothetical protein